jgi:hypothetical protein
MQNKWWQNKWWRVLSVIMAIGIIVSLVTMWKGVWGPQVFGSSGYITLSTQTEYDEFMTEMTRSDVKISWLELRENRYNPTWNAQPPIEIPVLPIEVEYSVRYSSRVTFSYGEKWLDGETTMINREIPTITLVLLGFGLAGLLWLLPGGLYQKEVKDETNKKVGRGTGKRVGASKA